MTRCLFASDLHGRQRRYESLLEAVRRERPAAVLLGGDLLPSGTAAMLSGSGSFVSDWLRGELARLRRELGESYPRVLLILGNDDGRWAEEEIAEGEAAGLWEHIHARRVELHGFEVLGYACVPPTPFLLKDWERYDVSQYVDPGCVSPEEGVRSVPVPAHEVRFGTIARDLAALASGSDLSRTVLLFHAPPYDTFLDRAALDGHTVEHVPLDVHVGSIAIRRFIEQRQPHLTLHGHVHEAARLSGSFIERIGRTVCLQGAHDGPELALVRFDLESPEAAVRELLD
ncbi:MAG TPA: metallophosphoesterase [Thermoanaerobaculaceae bacterium]|nr:metallophosphoesterase [Thermoanaerobaculaceae bacterium]HRS16469.1 metallophosphoesterase [Thermoanaerobaculaceae bacterium]